VVIWVRNSTHLKLRLWKIILKERLFWNQTWNFEKNCRVKLPWNLHTYVLLNQQLYNETLCDVDDWTFHSPLLCLFPFSVYYFSALWLFVPWKRCEQEIMSRSYFISCPCENTDFGQTRTPKEMTGKSCTPWHLLRHASDSQKNQLRNFDCRWQVPFDKLVNLTVTNKLVKLSYQHKYRTLN